MGKPEEAGEFTLPSYEQATGAPPPPPIEFHVYREASWFSKNDIVTGPDKQTMLYHLDFPHTFSGRWDLSLRRYGPQGPDVCRIVKGMWGDSFDVTMAIDGKVFRCQREGFFSVRYTFGGNGNTEWYTWKPDGHWIHQFDYSLYKASELDLPKEQRKVIAHWRTPSWSINKDGTLLIQPDHAHEQELILATALGIEVKESADAELASLSSSLGGGSSSSSSGGLSSVFSSSQHGRMPPGSIELHGYPQGEADVVLKGPDKQTPLFFLSVPVRFSMRWDCTLFTANLAAPPLAKITKGGFKESFDVQLLATSQVFPLKKHNSWSGESGDRFEFNNGYELLCWQADSNGSHNWSLFRASDRKLSKADRNLIAHWRTPGLASWSQTKNGTLLQVLFSSSYAPTSTDTLGVQLACTEERKLATEILGNA
ncbi:hypothetical protein JCM6882_008576 [Rhodosporidiobolus microsporus]